MKHKALRSARGAILIHVAFALLALLMFTAFVVDQGVMLSARRQAQNAADAGALAGAITLMVDLSAHEEAENAARLFAGQQNAIWGSQTADAHIDVSPLPFTCPDSAGGGEACIRVDVMRGVPGRDEAPHNNFLPTYFAHLFGVDRQGVRATATAQVAAGNAINCMKPWTVVDRWIDNSGTGENPDGWDQMDMFDPGVDEYIRPGFKASGDDNDIGLQLMLKGDSDWSAGWSMRVELGGGNGSNTYMQEIQGCPSWVPEVGIYDGSVPCNRKEDQNFEKGCINVRPGVAQGPTVKHGVDILVGLDPEAKWDDTQKKIVGGCTDDGTCQSVNPEGNDFSPRIIPLTLFDPQACVETSCQTGNNTVAQVVNIMGFFLEGTCEDLYDKDTAPEWCGKQLDKTVVGRIVNYPGQASKATGSAGEWSFIRIVRLVR